MLKIAVIKTGGKQYNVKSKDKIKIEKIKGEAGDKVDFNEILLVADEDGKDVKIGKPIVEGAKVEATILRHSRAKKITVIKYKAKVRYRRKLGHKQHFTEVEIGAIA
ncbi:MAG: 50S ribosomal protein L21 [bacterium]